MQRASHMLGMKSAVWLAALLLSACTSQPLPPSARLPPGALSGGGDPMRAAILTTAYVFGAPGAASPAARARALAKIEFLAADLPWDIRWSEFTPLVPLQLRQAREEIRAALGVIPGVPPQAVVDALFATARAPDPATALASLPATVFSVPEATLAILLASPPLPRTQAATALAERELMRIDSDGRNSTGGGGGSAHP